MAPSQRKPAVPHWASLGVDPGEVLEHLWTSSLVGLSFVKEDGKWAHPSPTLCQLLEYTSNELEGMTFADVTHPLDIAADAEMAKALARGDIPYYVMSKRYISKTGKVVWIKLHVSGFFDSNDKFLMYLSQIAPAEVWDPKAPAVRKAKPPETIVFEFAKKHWKWLLPALGGAITGGYKLWSMYQVLTRALPE